MSTSSAKPKRKVHYPDSDGKPMGETGIHVNATMELFETLKRHIFGGRPDVYVTADMFFYYEEGNPRAVKAPDIMVIKGVDHVEERRSFKLWVEGRVPNVIFEITSEESRRDDTTVKLEFYARIGVLEYFLFDPLGEYLNPRLQGYRLTGDHYEPIAPEADGGFVSLELGLGVRTLGTRVRLFNLADRQLIPDAAERAAKYIAALALENELAEERKAREKEEKKAKREAKKAESEKKKAEAERQNAEAERRKAEAERQNAEAERRKAEALAAEVAKLRALLGREGKDDPLNPNG